MSERRAVLLVAAAAFVLCALLTKSHILGWNDGSRFATVDALTTNRTVAIDGSPLAAGLGDKIRVRGRTYSDKAPLLPLLGAGVASAVAPLGVGLRTTPMAAVYLITLLSVGIFFALGCAYAYAFQRLLGFSQRVAFGVAGLTGTATLALSYAVVFSNHVPSGASALAGCYHLVRARRGSDLDAALGGFFLALAVAFDVAAVVFAAVVVVLLWAAPLRHWSFALAAAFPIVAGEVGYNLEITGSPIPPTFNGEVWTDASLPLHALSAERVHPYAPAEYAGSVFNLIAGKRGLFLFSPVMAAAAYGFVLLPRANLLGARTAWAVGATALVYLLTIVLLQNFINSASFGERRWVDLTFVFGIGLGPVLAAQRSASADLALRVLAALSVAIAAAGTVAPFGGKIDDWGFTIAITEFAGLAERAPVQAALDVALLCALVALGQRFIPARRGSLSGA
ncbi:MAG TPA: hypothetical protein VGN14_11165 [Candidatus Elarobacter sp.]|jgi:hypothetical protein